MLGAEQRIIEFLKKNPQGHLYVLTGYASVWGLAWLHKRTFDRPVTLLTGDARKKRFAKAAESDRMTALEFLSRDKVTVKTWYSKKTPGREAIAHAKAWIVKKPNGYVALVGSANLTEQGLRHNFEMMARAASFEVPALVAEMERALAKAKESKVRIASYLEELELYSTLEDWEHSEESDWDIPRRAWEWVAEQDWEYSEESDWDDLY